MRFDRQHLLHRLVAGVMMLPTALLLIVCIVGEIKQNLAYEWTPPPPSSWDWGVTWHGIRIDRTSGSIPNSALPAGVLRNPIGPIGPTLYGQTFRSSFGGKSYLFGSVGISYGYLHVGTQSIPIRRIHIGHALLLILTIPLAIWGVRIWRRPSIRLRRRKSGQCIACGYDLRATPERCPECGTLPKSGLIESS